MRTFGTGLLTAGIIVVIGGTVGGLLGTLLAQTAGAAGAGSPAPGGGLGLPWDGALGGSGVGLAGLIFYFYRQDRKTAEEAMIKVASEFRSIVEANTRAITALNTVLTADNNDD